MALKGKRCIVTGGASGFGKGIAEAFAASGARVAILDLNIDGAQSVADAIGGDTLAIACDVSSGAEVESAVAEAEQALGGIDIAVNNAGWSNRNGPLLDTDEATMRKLVDVNVMSIFHMTHAIVPRWRRQGGGVMLNIGSTAGLRPRPGLTWYNSTKGAANLLTKSLALELAPDNIRVCGIAPVMGETALLESFMGMPDTPENRERFIATIPLGRLSTPRDVANAAVFLCDDASEFLTGVVLEVDGGRTV